MTKNEKKELKLYLRNAGYFFGLFLSGAVLVKIGLEVTPESRSFTEEEYKGLVDLSEEDKKIFLAHYQNYIDEIAREIAELGLNKDAITAFGSYVAMQDSGAISRDGFKTGQSNFEIEGYEGLSITLGNGVCRHQADNLYRVLKRLGYDCGIVHGVIGTEEDIEKKNEQIGTAEKITGHAVVYVKGEDGTIIFLDPLYKTIFIQEYQDKWISATNKELYFEVWKDLDVHNGVYNDEVYNYNGKEKKHRMTWGTRCERALLKGEEYLEYYQEYESNYLLSTERSIEKMVDEYYEEKEREKVLKNAGYKFNEKGE